jgi:hypothetical protein
MTEETKPPKVAPAAGGPDVVPNFGPTPNPEPPKPDPDPQPAPAPVPPLPEPAFAMHHVPRLNTSVLS